jgi:3-isopropylmalate dehydrogenase
MNTHRVAVVPGDGTGPEVISEALKVLDVAAAGFGFQFST